LALVVQTRAAMRVTGLARGAPVSAAATTP